MPKLTHNELTLEIEELETQIFQLEQTLDACTDDHSADQILCLIQEREDEIQSHRISMDEL